MYLHSRAASEMLSDQIPTHDFQRKTSYHRSPDFRIENDNFGGDELADGYQMLEELGSGSFGVVYKAIETATGEIVAIKHVSLSLR